MLPGGLQIQDKWIANRRAEFVELQNNLRRRVPLDPQNTGDFGPRFHGHQTGEHSRGFFGECSPSFFSQIMADYFEREIRTAWNCLELDCYPVSLPSAKVKNA